MNSLVSPTRPWLLYGAYGYTGRLVIERALELGERPVLAGRDGAKLAAVAQEFGLEHRVAALDDRAALAASLAGMSVVAHCAGPFSSTAQPMVAACIEAGVHYLDITGEIASLEATFARDDDARAAGITVLPGAGFDVVPTDCLAALAARELPGAVQLELAFQADGGVSRGTARSALESFGAMSMCRIDGELAAAPADRRRLQVELVEGRSPVAMTAVSWGDLATAHRSTGVGTIYVYTALPRLAIGGVRVAAAVGALPGAGRLLRGALRAATSRMPNPSSAARSRSRSRIWVRATSTTGETAVRRMTTPNGYALTADAVVRAVQRLRTGTAPTGAQTPSMAFGADFAQTLDGVTVP